MYTRYSFRLGLLRVGHLEPWLLLHWGYIGAISWLCYGSVMATFGYAVAATMAAVSARREAVLWLPFQPGENKHVCSFTAPHIFFQPLSPRLAYHHFSKQCSQ